MRTTLTLLSLSLAVSLAPASADRVVLTNGNVFDDIVAEVGDTLVHLRLPFGELSLPRDTVLSVTKQATPLEEYLSREGALRTDPDAGAADWLALARWSREAGFPEGTRSAAEVAAQLDPALAGLGPLMGSLGYGFDDELGHWLPRDEILRRRGFVETHGTWVHREELLAREREAAARRERAEREAAAALREDRDERLDDLIDLLVLAELRERAAPPRQSVAFSSYTYPVAAFPGFLPAGRVVLEPAVVDDLDDATGESLPTYRDLAFRQPGSILPVRRHGGYQRLAN